MVRLYDEIIWETDCKNRAETAKPIVSTIVFHVQRKQYCHALRYIHERESSMEPNSNVECEGARVRDSGE